MPIHARPIQEGSAKLAELIHSTAIRLLRSVRQADEASGLTASRLSALSMIVFSGKIALGDLAKAEQVRPPTMTRIVNALERLQLIVRSPNPADGRLIHITATNKGKRELLKGRARRVQLIAKGIQGLTAAERKKLSDALEVIQKLAERGSVA